MPIKVFSLSFYLVFGGLDNLMTFRNFLDTWSENYQIKEGVVQGNGTRKTPFQIFFTVSCLGVRNPISSEKVIQLIATATEEMKINNFSIQTDKVN